MDEKLDSEKVVYVDDSSELSLDEDACASRRFVAALGCNTCAQCKSFKSYYQMPSMYEGNLPLILHLPSNALDEIFERLKHQTPKMIPTIQETQCFGTVHQRLSKELSLPTEENVEEEASLEMTEEFKVHNESILEVGPCQSRGSQLLVKKEPKNGT